MGMDWDIYSLLRVAEAPEMCSGRLGKNFTDNLRFGNQPIIKVVTVLTSTLLIY